VPRDCARPVHKICVVFLTAVRRDAGEAFDRLAASLIGAADNPASCHEDVESGAGALNLHVQSENDWLVSAAPAVEIGTQWPQGGYTWRPYVRAGVRFLSKDNFRATASFEGSPAGIAPFRVTSPLDRTLAEVSTGFDVWQGSNFSLRLSYDGRFESHTTDNGGALELRAAF